MEANTLQDICIKILRFALNETELDSTVKARLTPDVLAALYALAKRHDVAHMVAYGLDKNGLLGDDDISSKFNQERDLSLYRCIHMNGALTQICNTLDEAEIPYILLKGAVIRPYYPEESMRTSCDIDVLIKEETLHAAVDALTRKGFTCGERHYHDITLCSPNNVHLELHFNVQENIPTLDAVLKDAWLYAVPVKNSRYAFSNEFFLFHMFAHMSYHFLSGGCGIRPLMDIWVMEHSMGITYSQAKELLKKAGIEVFATEISHLADRCFSDTTNDMVSDTLLSYIFDGGVYGTVHNKIAVTKAKTNSTFNYAVQRLFLPYRTMTIQYPILKQIPLLLPCCWMLRIVKALFGGNVRKSVLELRTAKNIPDNNMDSIIHIRERLGL